MLECINLNKKYLNKEAVKDVSFSIEPGKVYALLGPNGSGKSTLMKMIVGLTKPTKGKIVFEGKEITNATKAFITYMPTESYFYSYMNCNDIAIFYKDFYKDFSTDKFFSLLQEMDLDPKIKASKMSSGMMAKLKVAVALSRESRLIMLDEPLNGIDIIARDKILSCIEAELSAGKSFIISSHLVDELEKMVDNAIFIKNGDLIDEGKLDDLRTKYDKSLVDIYKQIYA